MGTRGVHCLAGNPGVALTSGVARLRAQTMSSGLNFPPSWGSPVETVMISGAQGGHAQLQARRRQYLQILSPQLQVQSGENHLFSFTAFPGVTKSHWLWVGRVHIADPITVTMKTQCIDWRRPSSCASSFELFPDGQLPPSDCEVQLPDCLHGKQTTYPNGLQSWYSHLASEAGSILPLASMQHACQILRDPMDHRRPGSSVHWILQARILEWVAMLSSRVSSWPRDWTCISYIVCIGRRCSLTLVPPGKPSMQSRFYV